MCHVPDHGQISGCVIRPDPAFIVAECHIHHPMQTVLYAPVVADCRSDETRRRSQGGDVKTGLLLGLSVDLACAIDDGDGFQPGPVMPVVEPGHVVDNNDGACLDAAVIAIDGLAVADRGITEADGLLLGHEEFDVITKTALIAFQGQDVIRLLVDDLLRDLALAPHSVDGEDGTSLVSRSSNLGIAMISLDFSVTLT